jgi:hypothetical protein
VFPELSLRRVINPQTQNTMFLISVPNVANLWVRLNLLFGRFEYQDRGILDRSHLRFYTKRCLLKRTDCSGLQMIDLQVTPHLEIQWPHFSALLYSGRPCIMN